MNSGAGSVRGIGDSKVPGDVKPQRRAIRISTEAFERAHDLAPGWDRYALEQIYLEWAADKDAARSEDARFLDWVKSYTKGKAAP
jgi:hypothetical protein